MHGLGVNTTFVAGPSCHCCGTLAAMASYSALALFALLLLLEEHQRGTARAPIGWHRIVTNWGLGLINMALVALVPVGALFSAIYAEAGPLSGWSALAAFAPVLLVRSFVAYCFHRLFHAVPALWRIHRVHHADTAIDTSTGLRTHPIEALVSAGSAAVVVSVLAPPALAVVAIDALLLGAALWQHAAIRLPASMASLAEWVFVTPRSHLVHHSRLRSEHDSNYGDLLAIWDRLLGTWSSPMPPPRSIGLDNGPPPNSLSRQLFSPFSEGGSSASPAEGSNST